VTLRVTLAVWTLPARDVPRALLLAARRRQPVGSSFSKVLGTGKGTTFLPRDATPTRWAVLTCWTGMPRGHPEWESIASESWSIDLRPLRSRGHWAGREPFGQPGDGPHDGPVAALTRARVKVLQWKAFYASVPAVTEDLTGPTGPVMSFGIGEAPVGLQGTFSVWRNTRDLTDFAFGRPAHRRVVQRTQDTGWYVEQLFARFAIEGSAGTIDGTDPLRSMS
jgi:hypothetical protein